MRSVTEITCPNCNKIDFKKSAEVNRQVKRGRKIYCSRECSYESLKKKPKKFPKFSKECPQCGHLFTTSNAKRAPKFCCQICATKYARKFVNFENTSISMKKAWERGDFDKMVAERAAIRIAKAKENGYICNGNATAFKLNCCICSSEFYGSTPKIKTCSKKCCKKLMSKNSQANPNCGGETNYKKYQYKGMWMDSKWEVAVARLMDLLDIEWVRSRTIMFYWTDLKGNKRRYYPDFYLPQFNIYLDPKNKFLLKQDAYKIKQVQVENDIKIICGLIDDIFAFVKFLKK